MVNLTLWRKSLLAFGVLFTSTSLMGGCVTPKPGSPEAEIAKEEARIDATENTVEQLPDWFINPPQNDNSVFAAGTATSPDIQLAMDKSILNAKRTLADRINGLMSSKMKEFITEVGSGEDTEVVSEVERVTSNLITEVNVAGYRQAEAKILPQGKQYRAYVLLEYPSGSANKILVDQVKKNKILEARLRASKAFQELEDEIKRARGS